MAELAKAGSLIQVDSGEHSDYQVHGFFVALVDFDPMKELSLYLLEHPETISKYNPNSKYGFRKSTFLAVLVAKGYLLEINRSVLYLGSYDESKDVSFSLYPSPIDGDAEEDEDA